MVVITRFKADGVTPDVFTPEPESIGLALSGLITLGAIGYRRRNALASKAADKRLRLRRFR